MRLDSSKDAINQKDLFLLSTSESVVVVVAVVVQEDKRCHTCNVKQDRGLEKLIGDDERFFCSV